MLVVRMILFMLLILCVVATSFAYDMLRNVLCSSSFKLLMGNPLLTFDYDEPHVFHHSFSHFIVEVRTGMNEISPI